MTREIRKYILRNDNENRKHQKNTKGVQRKMYSFQ